MERQRTYALGQSTPTSNDSPCEERLAACLADGAQDAPGNNDPALEKAPAFPAQTELDAANKWANAQIFGGLQFASQSTVFSSVVIRSCRQGFPIDNDVYSRSVAIQTQALGEYGMMRLLTLLSFFITMYLLSALGVQYLFALSAGTGFGPYPSWVLRIFGKPSLPMALGWVTLLMGAFFVARTAIREFFLRNLDHKAASAAFALHSRYAEILSKVTEHCAASKRRIAPGGPWEDRARDHIKCALWNGKRAEYLDRFTTTLSWRIEFWIRVMEITSRVIGISVMVLVSWAVLTAFGGKTNLDISNANMFGRIALLALAWPLYLLVSGRRKPGSFWTDRFRAQIANAGDSEEHYFDKMGNNVMDFVDEVKAKEFNGNRTPGGM